MDIPNNGEPDFTEYWLPDFTEYWFKKVIGVTKTAWKVVARHPDNGNVVEIPFNKGKFTFEDYSRSYDYAEYAFWDWFKMSQNDRIAMRGKWIREMNSQGTISVKDYYETKLGQINPINCLDSCKTIPCDWDDKPYPLPPPAVSKQEGNNPMRYDTPYTNITVAAASTAQADPEQKKRDYLRCRIQDIGYEKSEELYELFGLRPAKSPQTPQELIDRLKAGKYTVDAKNWEPGTYFDWYDFFSWADPAVKGDRPGYNNAKEELDAFRQSQLDLVAVKDIDTAFGTIAAMESWKTTIIPNTKA